MNTPHSMVSLTPTHNQIVWPSAARAWDLLNGVKAEVRKPDVTMLTSMPDRKKRLLAETDDIVHRSARAIDTARPTTSRCRSRSPSSVARRRSASNSDAHARLRSQSHSLRMEPLQLSQAPYPPPPSQSPIDAIPPLVRVPSSVGFEPQLVPMADHEPQRARQQQQLPSFHAPQPIHSRWVIPNSQHPYELHPESPTRFEDLQHRVTDGMHENSGVVSSHQMSFSTDYPGTDFQRESPADRYSFGVPHMEQAPSANDQVNSEPFQDMFQPSHMNNNQRYAEPIAASRGLWNTYTPTDPFGNYTTVPVGTTTPPGPDNMDPHTSSNMLPPMMIPTDGFGRSQPHRLASIAEPATGFSALNSYFANTSGTSTAYLSGENSLDTSLRAYAQVPCSQVICIVTTAERP